MRLIAGSIHNFRGVIDGSFELKGYSLLVGANNAGKSTVIDAIRAFYEKDGFKFTEEKDFPYQGAADKESWIELQFLLADAELESLKDDYKCTDKTLKVRKYFATEELKSDGKSAKGFIFAYKQDGSLANDPFYGAKNVQSGKFGDLIYIPAISKVDEHAKLSGPSALRDLLADILGDVVADGEAYKKFAESVDTFMAGIREEKTADDRSLSGFEGELNELLGPWNAEFKLKAPPPSAQELVKNMVEWDVIDKAHGKAQDISYYGSGFQRHFIYSLIQLGARYLPKKEKKKGKDFVPDLNLILFEEPEAFLHPPQQEVLARNLRKVAGSESWQALCATHSANFVSRNSQEIPAIIRVAKNGPTTSIHQINDTEWDSLVDANQAIGEIAKKHPKMAKKLHEDDLKPEMEAVKHFLWLNPDRSSAFFARHVLLVEGVSEVGLINRLVSDGRLGAEVDGVYVLDCLGKYNVHRFMNLLIRLGIPHSVLFDADTGKGEEHEELNTLIQETAHESLTLRIEGLSEDLEAFVGAKPEKISHRKPQSLLLQYESGGLDHEKVDDFCKLVSSCLP